MGDVLSSLFPDPALLPGGPKIVAICDSLANRSLTNNTMFNTTDYASLGCDTSPVYGFIQLLVLFAFYGYILFVASNFISDGSEMLTLIPSVKHIVGSIVLPVLGAVPDGAIVLFSGLGPIDTVQEEISVGVGALAGSTVMLLTIPWFMSILAGKVPIRDGTPVYGKKKRKNVPPAKTCCLCSDGVAADPIVRANGIVMAITLVSYLLVQIPALTFGAHGIAANETSASVLYVESVKIKYWALAGFIVATLFFIAYLIYSAKNTGNEENEEAHGNLMSKMDFIGAKYVRESAVDIVSLFHQEFVQLKQTIEQKNKKRRASLQQHLHTGETPPSLVHLRKRLERFISKFFKYADKDGSGRIDLGEYAILARTLGIPRTSVTMAFESMDKDGDGSISYEEFLATLLHYVENYDVYRLDQITPKISKKFTMQATTEGVDCPESQAGSLESKISKRYTTSELEGGLEGVQSEAFPDTDVDTQLLIDAHVEEDEGGDDDGGDEESEEEASEELYDVDEQGRRSLNMNRVKMKSLKLMTIGTIIVLLFSDPMCAILSQIGVRIGISAFYISFVLAPMASNASEVIASYSFAKKKTRSSIAVSLTQLEGAGIMNNTFCVAIFLILIYCRGVAWTFTAETVAIVVVELLVMAVACKKVMTLCDGFIVLAFYPLSLGIVIVMEKVLGFD